jgi:hypothetical protein
MHLILAMPKDYIDGYMWFENVELGLSTLCGQIVCLTTVIQNGRCEAIRYSVKEYYRDHLRTVS